MSKGIPGFGIEWEVLKNIAKYFGPRVDPMGPWGGLMDQPGKLSGQKRQRERKPQKPRKYRYPDLPVAIPPPEEKKPEKDAPQNPVRRRPPREESPTPDDERKKKYTKSQVTDAGNWYIRRRRGRRSIAGARYV